MIDVTKLSQSVTISEKDLNSQIDKKVERIIEVLPWVSKIKLKSLNLQTKWHLTVVENSC